MQIIDKSKLNNVMVSILQNIVEKPMVQEEQDFNSDKAQNNEKDNNTNSVIQNPNSAEIKSEIIERENFASMIKRYSEKDAVENFAIHY